MIRLSDDFYVAPDLIKSIKVESIRIAGSGFSVWVEFNERPAPQACAGHFHIDRETDSLDKVRDRARTRAAELAAEINACLSERGRCTPMKREKA